MADEDRALVLAHSRIVATLDEALDCLDSDHQFLLKRDVFTAELIDTYISWKRKNEAEAIRLRPHAYEFRLQFDI